MLEDILDRKPKYAGEVMSGNFFANVFAWMFSGLAISGVLAWAFGHSPALMMNLIGETGFTPLGYLVMFAPLAIVLVMQMAYHKLSMPILALLFFGYSALIGMSISFIFMVYSLGTIANVFLITALTYGAMAVLGYTTKQDLSGFGKIMYMLFIGIFIASLVNMFMQSSGMDYVISFIGIFVFTGLTAYKMQELKYMGNDPELSGESRQKLALIGGLQLYILFINLFLSLLRVMGDRN